MENLVRMCRVLLAVWLLITPCGAVEAEHASVDLLGVDMCPECRSLGTIRGGKSEVNSAQVQSAQPRVETSSNTVGISFPPYKHLTDCFDYDNYGSDMCPEKSQPMGAFVRSPEPTGDLQTRTLVREMQDLMKIQQSQIDQLGEFVKQLGRKDTYGLGIESVVGEKPYIPHQHDRTETSQNEENAAEVLKEQPKTVSPSELSKGYGMGVPCKGETAGSGAGVMTIARYKPAWAEHFSFLSAVKVNADVSCLLVLPQEGDDGVSRYIAVGDVTGRLYIFMWHGDLMVDYVTVSSAPITAMLSYILMKNETILVTGHADGSVSVHRVEEAFDHGQEDATVVTIEYIRSLVPPPRGSSRATNQPVYSSSMEDNSLGAMNLQAIRNLKMYKIGKIRYTLVSDESGKIQLYRDNGTLYGSAVSPELPLEFVRTPSAQRLVFLTSSGVGWLDLRTMQVRSSPCEGMNGSTVTGYAFDVAARSKANGFTADGDLVSVSLTGDMLQSECQVKRRRKVEVPGPYSPQALKGYFLAATPGHILVYNTTLQMGFNYVNFWIGGPRPVFSVALSEVAQSFLQTPVTRSQWPLITTNRDRLVSIGFGGGYVAMFRSTLPVARPVDLSSKFWSSPVFIGAIVILIVWLLFTRSKQSTGSFSPDYPYGGPVRRMDTSGLNFDDRGENRSSEQRRFRSPTRGYVTPNSSSFNAGALSFRSSTEESGSYNARREPLFASNQPVGELRDTEVERENLSF